MAHSISLSDCLAQRAIHRPGRPTARRKGAVSEGHPFLHAVMGTLLVGLSLFLAGYVRASILARRAATAAPTNEVPNARTTSTSAAAHPVVVAASTGSVAPARLNPGGSLRTAWRLAAGTPGAHRVLFTFDDGPNPGTTETVLNILDAHHVHAAFFVVGENLEAREGTDTPARALLREEHSRGHVIGNHSMTHPQLSTLSASRVAWQMDRTDDLISDVIGERPVLFRPPYGDYGPRVRAHVVRGSKDLWLWSIDSRDWEHVDDAKTTAESVIAQLKNNGGGTILMHDTHAWSAQALETVLAWIESENERIQAEHGAPYEIVDAATFFAALSKH